MTLTQGNLKRKLWELYGTTDSPAEWDGETYGGGKLSQRYWEYFKVIEYLYGLDRHSVVLDIGGGSPKTKSAFFVNLLLQCGIKFVVVDPEAVGESTERYTLVAAKADYHTLQTVFEMYPITHITCISVLEHVRHLERIDMMKSINDHFKGDIMAVTFEYHPVRRFFEEQLTMKSMGETFRPLTNMYPGKMDASPTHCTNAFLTVTDRGTTSDTPLWYPMALQFRRIL